jgi:hypothetical protein
VNKERQWLPTMPDLIDRLSIHQLKEVMIPKHKAKYAEEMRQMMNDINVIIEEKDVKLSAELIRAIIILSQINAHIWYNETKARAGESQDFILLRLTHGLNGIRNNMMNNILDLIGGKERKDYKVDCLAAEFKDWEISF